jgi:hypothetical protein
MMAEEVLNDVLDLLDELGIPYMVTGSFASNAHGVPRLTQDADVIVEADLPGLISFITRLGQGFYADMDAAREAYERTGMVNAIHQATGFKIDIILKKSRSFSREEFARRQKVMLLGRTRWFASPEDTILAKLEWSKMEKSERQFEDALNIAKVQGEALDKEYVSKWAKELRVEKLVQRLFSEL